MNTRWALPKTYVGAVGVGLLCAVAAVVLSTLVFVLGEALYWRLVVLPRFMSDNESSFGGGTIVSINIAPILVVAAIAFVAGFWWRLRRDCLARYVRIFL